MKRGSLLLGSLLVGLLLAEGILRWRTDLWKNAVQFEAGFRFLEYDPVLGWRNTPGFHDGDIRINSLSFRGPEAATHKRAGTVRVVCAGDSRTFGTWLDFQRIRFDNAYPPLLQRVALAAGGAQVEVINAGVVGYSSAQGLRQLQMRILPLDPDVLVVSFGFNDHAYAWNAALRSLEPRPAWARDLLYRFGDLRTVQFGMRLYQGLAPHPAPLSVRWVDPDEYDYTLRRFTEVSQRHGVRLVFLTQALRPIEQGESPPAFPNEPRQDPYAMIGARNLADLHRLYGEYQGVLRRVAAETNTPVADAAAAFAAHRGEPLFGAYDLVHPNPTGARVIAQTVYATLHDIGAL
jgi:lysophospholipase L1-like esterase